LFNDAKDVVCPSRIRGQPQEVHQRGPRLLPPGSQE
jgi:hypothetical protein